MLQHLRPALVIIAFFTALLGLAYPLTVTGIAQAAFPRQADGSLLRDGAGRVVGSELIGQAFADPAYLHARPSAAGQGYDASASSGSNLGPLNENLITRVRADADRVRAETSGAVIPADAVTASASGLDPHVSPAFARLQASRIAAARGLPVAQVLTIIDARTEGRLLGFVGQPRVNVLRVNLDLDARAAANVPRSP